MKLDWFDESERERPEYSEDFAQHGTQVFWATVAMLMAAAGWVLMTWGGLL